METDQLILLSSRLLIGAFFLYLLATVFFALAASGKKGQAHDTAAGDGHIKGAGNRKKWGRIGFVTTLLGFGLQTAYYIFRWIGQGHAPVSTMFEFMVFLAHAVVLGFTVIYLIYRVHFVGAFALPVVLGLLGWAAVFDTSPQPLIDALQSHWLKLHVSTVAIGQGLFAVGFATGLMYIIRSVDQSASSKRTLALESILLCVLMVVGFIILSFGFALGGYEVSFSYENEEGLERQANYSLPPLTVQQGSVAQTPGAMGTLLSLPLWIDAVKFNSALWGVIGGIVLYTGLRLLFRQRLGARFRPRLQGISSSMLDEITYRAIAIGFPIFTLGGLIFAMIWAQEAWGRFWGWDPKEVWALITWLFYAAYLHLRLSKGWEGERSAWLAVIGFVIVMINLIVVNLVIAGLHSYV